jgi:formate transporter
MDCVPPLEVVSNMVGAGSTKGALPAKDLLIRGFLSGALLGFATSLAITATVQSGVPLVGALVFPVGFVMIVLLGLELATGSFSLLPLAYADGKLSLSGAKATMADWWIWNQIPVTIGNFIGGSVFTGFALYLTDGQKKEASPATITPSAIAEPAPVS